MARCTSYEEEGEIMRVPTLCTLLVAASTIWLTACNSAPSASTIPGSTSVSSTSSVVPTKMKKQGGNRPAELFNQILPYPCYTSSSQPCPTDFEVVYQGNVTSDIPQNQPLDVHENAFCNPSGSQSCAPTVTYNPTSNTTTVEWSGPIVYHNRRDNRPGVHFGLATAEIPRPDIGQFKVSSEWTYASTAAAPMPIVSINTTQPKSSATWNYAVVYLAGSTKPSGTAEYATWNEIAYVPGPDNTVDGQPKLIFANYGNKPIYITSSGIVTGLAVPTDSSCVKNPACPENLELLGNLDATGFPPPGSASSPFERMHKPPKILKPQE
jgi:hypothetical protein